MRPLPDISAAAWWLLRHTTGTVLIIDHDEALPMARRLEGMGVAVAVEAGTDSLRSRHDEPYDSVILGNLASHPRPDLILDAAVGAVRPEGSVVVDASPGGAAIDHVPWERLDEVLATRLAVLDVADGLDPGDRPWIAFSGRVTAPAGSITASELAHRELHVIQRAARKKAMRLNIGADTAREVKRRANAYRQQLANREAHLGRLSAERGALELESNLIRQTRKQDGIALGAELQRLDAMLESRTVEIAHEAARVAGVVTPAAERLHDMESRLGVVSGVVGGLAGRLAVAESEVERVRFGLERVKSRRGFRLAAALADDLRSPRRWWRLPVDLVRALKRRPAPEPARTHIAQEYLPAGLAPPLPMVEAPLGPMRYPHLRVAYWGRFETFNQVATHLLIESIDLETELAIGFDFVLIEPSLVDGSVPEPVTVALTAARDAAIPTMMFLRSVTHLDLACVADITVFLTEDPALGKLAAGRYPDRDVICLAPSVDPAVFNPIWWQREPANGVAVITTRKLDDETATLVESLDATIYAPAGTGIKEAAPLPDTPHELATFYKTHLAALVSPHLAASLPAHQQHVLELAATGTPIITTDPGPLHGLLEPEHYLPAATATEAATAVTELQQLLTRERLSIRTRRHVLTHHTRLQRLEQLLTHLDIPTRPPDRISILLATNRPDFIEHALTNVTKQTHPDKELILILHGDHFDPDTITAHTTNLPYPVTVLPCPGTWTLGDCLNHGLDHATGTYITKMDDDDYYGPHHLTDTLLAHTYTNAHITGKWGNIVYLQNRDITIDWRVDREEVFGNHLPGATILLARDLLGEFRFNRVSRAVDSTLLLRARHRGAVRYSTHRFNFIRVRHGRHTFDRDDDYFVELSTGETRPGLDIANAEV